MEKIKAKAKDSVCISNLFELELCEVLDCDAVAVVAVESIPSPLRPLFKRVFIESAVAVYVLGLVVVNENVVSTIRLPFLMLVISNDLKLEPDTFKALET